MAIGAFPPVEEADEDGVLCVGGDLEVESLVLAYSQGIFPWPISQRFPLVWFAPPRRALLFLDELRVSRSLRRAQKDSPFQFSLDERFDDVITECAQSKNRKQSGATWITPDMVRAYRSLHRAGYCHSVEAIHDGLLVGGLYGVSLGGMFAGESMFYREPNASKLALLFLLEHLRARGAKWIDCQQLTPLFGSLGAREVPREEFRELLATALRGGPLFG